MMSVKDIVIRIRSSTHDKQQTGYRDSDILGYINDGVRLMRRIIMSIRPELLADDPVTGTLLAGESTIKLEKMISKVLEVTAGDKRLEPLSANMVMDAQATGIPGNFYLQGWKTIRVYPIPEKDIDLRKILKGTSFQTALSDMLQYMYNMLIFESLNKEEVLLLYPYEIVIK